MGRREFARGILAVAAALAVASGPGARFSNCALRNPQRQIYEIFPEASSFKTVFGNVDHAVAATIEERFGLDVGYSDLGKTSMCIVFRDGAPIGFVHARSEVGRRGAIEIVWALDIELRVRDMRVQRSREENTPDIEAEAFRRQLQGADWSELQELLGRFEGQGDSLGLAESSRHLGRIAVECGFKTAAILGSGYLDTVRDAQLLGAVHRAFPGTARVSVERSRGDGVAASLDSVFVVRAEDESGGLLGRLFQADWVELRRSPTVWLFLDAGDRLRDARVFGPVGATVRARLDGAVGLPVSELGTEPDATGRFFRAAQRALAPE